MSNDIVDIVLSLPSEQRKGLMEKIRISLDEENEGMRTSAHMSHLLKISAKVLDIPFIKNDRTRNAVLGRSIVAEYLIEKGLALETIGDLMGRDHSSVINMRNNMEYYFSHPNQYERENRCYNEFKVIVENETHR